MAQRSDPHIAETATARIRVREAGTGDPPIVLAADPPNVVTHYDVTLKALAVHNRTIVLELPGFGHSRFRRGRRLTLQNQADAVRELLHALDARPAILAFPCLTAFVALQAAADEPEAVTALVLPQATDWPGTTRWMDRVDRRHLLQTPGLGQTVNRLFRRRIVRTWYENALGDKTRAGAYTRIAHDALHHGATFPLATALQRMRRNPPKTPRVPVPALTVWGTNDRTHRHSDPQAMKRHAPQASLAQCTSGHFPELERPEWFASLIHAWRTGQGPP